MERAEARPNRSSAATEDSYVYRPAEITEPDWRRYPPWRGVTAEQWGSARWQRAQCVKNVRDLHDVTAGALGDSFYDEVARDQRLRAGMPLLITPQMMNTIAAGGVTAEAFRADPVRRYMLPLASERDARHPSHPMASRDSLHETEMWAVEGLTHRYPTKVLAELVTTCPQYCGHCTRMDLVGPSTAQVAKARFTLRRENRWDRMIGYVRDTPAIRDVVVSGGDVANVPWPRLQSFVGQILDIPHVKDVRLATKALVGLPQHWLDPEVRKGMEVLAGRAAARGVSLAIHTHANAAAQVTPLVARAAREMFEAGIRNIRNQGVLLAGVNDSGEALLDLCFRLLDSAQITPYYFYLCDIVPGAEHWRISLGRAQELQDALMGYLPGFATPRLVCDVPYLGKRWVHQVVEYDRRLGVSTWSHDPPGRGAAGSAGAMRYYDPIHTLPASGQAWWSATGDDLG